MVINNDDAYDDAYTPLTLAPTTEPTPAPTEWDYEREYDDDEVDEDGYTTVSGTLTFKSAQRMWVYAAFARCVPASVVAFSYRRRDTVSHAILHRRRDHDDTAAARQKDLSLSLSLSLTHTHTHTHALTLSLPLARLNGWWGRRRSALRPRASPRACALLLASCPGTFDSKVDGAEDDLRNQCHAPDDGFTDSRGVRRLTEYCQGAIDLRYTFHFLNGAEGERTEVRHDNTAAAAGWGGGQLHQRMTRHSRVMR